jgi:hypothetical protein|tara:strand:+ start:2112 stop:2534 length:423 start_codon:yes stop_codon:yes gene_type:complete
MRKERKELLNMTNKNRLESFILKFKVDTWRVHAIFGFNEVDNQGNPIITHVTIKIKPEDSTISTLVKESIISFNKAIEIGDFIKHTKDLSKSGFVGVICNYIVDNLDKISDFREDFKVAPNLFLDPQNRLSENSTEKDFY